MTPPDGDVAARAVAVAAKSGEILRAGPLDAIFFFN
jgi:hypothetical protein